MILAIDLGSTSFKAGLFDADLALKGAGSAALEYSFAPGGCVELDADRVREAVAAAIRECLQAASVDGTRLRALAITSQAQTFAVLRGEALRTPFLSWQDSRARAAAARLSAEPRLAAFAEHTSFSACSPFQQLGKIRHLQDDPRTALAAEERVLLLPSWVAYAWSGSACVDDNLAAMSGLYSLVEPGWWQPALEACGLRATQLPAVRPIGTVAARTTERARAFGLEAGIPIVLAGNDQTAGAYGAGVHESGAMLLTLGTAQVAYACADALPAPAAGVIRGPFPGGRFYRMAADDVGGSIINWARGVLAGCADDEAFFARAAEAPAWPGKRSAEGHDMTDLLIHNVRLVREDSVDVDAAVLVADGRIRRVLREAEIATYPAATRHDGRGALLAPGFIDLHIHGCHTHLVDEGPEAVAALAALLPRYGVTGFLPTLVPCAHAEYVERIRALAAMPDAPGARILGLHSEGPCVRISGALAKGVDRRPEPKRVQEILDACGARPLVMTVSPDVDGIGEAIALLARRGARIFLSHTQADVLETRAAIAAGARHATHFYDVFLAPPERDTNVRACGAVEAILADPRVSVDFILDGVHVDPEAVAMALACKAPDRVCLISDANVGAGLPPGRYRFAGTEIAFAHAGAPARLVNSAGGLGGLAGSGLTLDQALRNARDMLGLELAQAVRLVSGNPARVLGLEDRIGRIAEGYDADLVLLDADLRVVRTWVAGACVFAREEEEG